jgi:hypothetical protein
MPFSPVAGTATALRMSVAMKRFRSDCRRGCEFGAGIKMAVERGWLELHESGTYVRLLNAGETI